MVQFDPINKNGNIISRFFLATGTFAMVEITNISNSYQYFG